jgi:DNA-binding beta-propeller fold protein YncE
MKRLIFLAKKSREKEIILEDRKTYPYLSFLKQEFPSKEIFLTNPDLVIIGSPMDIDQSQFRFIQYINPGDDLFSYLTRIKRAAPVLVLNPDLFDAVTQMGFRRLGLGREIRELDSPDPRRIVIRGQAYSLNRSREDFIISLTDYLIPDLSHLAMEYLPIQSFFAEWGPMRQTRNEPNHFESIGGIAISPNGREIYITDEKRRQVQVFALEANDRSSPFEVGDRSSPFEVNFLQEWSWDFIYPKSITVGNNGQIYLLDNLFKKIVVLSPNGVFLNDWRIGYNFPGAIAISHRRKEIYIVVNHQVVIFTLEGIFLRSLDGAQAQKPNCIYPQGIAISPNEEEIYITDQHTRQVQVYSPEGILLRQWGRVIEDVSSNGSKCQMPILLEKGDNNRLSDPRGIALSPNGEEVYVIDRQEVKIFTPKGRFLRKWNSTGTRKLSPEAIAISPNGNVYLSDATRQRIQVFGY